MLVDPSGDFRFKLVAFRLFKKELGKVALTTTTRSKLELISC